MTTLKSLLLPGRHRPKVAIHLSWRASQNQAHHRLARHADIMEAAEDVNLLVCQHHSSLCRILDGKLCLSVFTGDTADRASKMLSLQRLHVLDLKALDIQIVEPQQRDRIVDIEAEGKGADKVGALLQRSRVDRLLRRPHLDGLVFGVHAHLEEKVFHKWRVDLGPAVLERSEAVGRDGDFAAFVAVDGCL